MIDFVPILCPVCDSRLRWIGSGKRTGCIKDSQKSYHFVVNYEDDWRLYSIQINWKGYQIFVRYIDEPFTDIYLLKEELVFLNLVSLDYPTPIDLLNIQPTLDLLQTYVVFS